MKKQEQLQKIFKRYIDNQYSESDFRLLQDHFQNDEDRQALDRLIGEQLAEMNEQAVSGPVERVTGNVKRKLLLQLSTRRPRSRQVTIRRIIAAAAVVIAVLTAGLYFYKFAGINQVQPEASSLAKAILPGGNKARLTLANGQTIDLSSEQEGIIIAGDAIKYADGTALMDDEKLKTENKYGSVNSISTPKGGLYQIVLSDGTKVWLNSASTLKYPALFTADSREVELIGEAYFEVAKKTSLPKGMTGSGQDRVPFIVHTANQDVKVFGTRFNVNSYENEPFSTTTLVEGSVGVYSSPGMYRMLTPGQQARVIGEDIFIQKVNVEPSVAWKEGLFLFEDMELSSIMRQLERWYDIEVDYLQLPKLHFTGGIAKNVPLSEVLNMLERSGKFKFKMNKNKLSM